MYKRKGKKMKTLTEEKLASISGGGLSFGAISAIIGGVVFLIGLIDGIVRPGKCS